jgi:chromosome segregation ATPase
MSVAHKLALVDAQQNYLAREGDLKGKIVELERTIDTRNGKIREVKDQIDEKNKVIATHTTTIQQRDTTIRGIEVDLADLFQKMVQCDKQIRNEMQEKFHHDKAEWEAHMALEHRRNMEDQAQDLSQRYNQDLHVSLRAA